MNHLYRRALTDLVSDVYDFALLFARLLVDVVEDGLVEFEAERPDLGRALVNHSTVTTAGLELRYHVVVDPDAVRPTSSLY